MNKLWVQLTLAFSLVTLAGVALVALLANRQVGAEFRSFVAQSQVDGSPLVNELSDYYAAHAGWAGVDATLRDFVAARRGMSGRGPAITLADAGGAIVYSTAAQPGPRLAEPERAAAAPIRAGGATVGFLLVQAGAGGPMSPAGQQFLAQVNRSLLQAGLLAGALQQSEQLRRSMIADVSHELRTPLTVIQGNLRALLDDVYPLDKAEIATIYDESVLLGRLVSDLRQLAQAEAGQLALRIQPSDAGALARGAIVPFEAGAAAQGVALTLAVPPGLPAVAADADRVRQVLHNLVANALRYTPAGGTVACAAHLDGETWVLFEVRDTGAGIAADDLPHVFERFWRADRSRSREQGGSGLGLAIARQIVEAHGGRIGAESQPGQGSRFWFYLPAAP